MSDLRSRNESVEPPRPVTHASKIMKYTSTQIIIIVVTVVVVTFMLSYLILSNDSDQSAYTSQLERDITEKQNQIELMLKVRIPQAEEKGFQEGKTEGYKEGTQASNTEKMELRREIDSLKQIRDSLTSKAKEYDNLLNDLDHVCRWIEKQDGIPLPRECKRLKK